MGAIKTQLGFDDIRQIKEQLVAIKFFSKRIEQMPKDRMKIGNSRSSGQNLEAEVLPKTFSSVSEWAK